MAAMRFIATRFIPMPSHYCTMIKAGPASVWRSPSAKGTNSSAKRRDFTRNGLIGKSIEEIMADFGALQRAMADEQQFRWLGPHKGVVQLALASVTNACWDLWAKTRGRTALEIAPRPFAGTNRRHARPFLPRRRTHRVTRVKNSPANINPHVRRATAF